MRWSGSSLCLALAMGAANAAGGAAVLSGRATIGPEERVPTLRLACDPGGPGLSATLTVPRFEGLSRRLDFDALEGPTGSTAPLTGIQVAGSGGIRGVRARASGAAAVDPEGGFSLTVAGAGRGEDPLRGLGPALAEAGARITWTQGSPRAGDAPLVAVFAVGEAEAAVVKAALAACLGR